MAQPTATNKTPPAEPATPAGTPSIKSLRPVALLGLAVALIAGGMVVAFLRKPKAEHVSPLKEAAALIERSEFEEAVKVLNEKMVPLVNTGVVPRAEQAEYLRMRAHATFAAQEAKGQDAEANNRQIVNDYRGAEKLDAHLTSPEIFEAGWAQASLGELAAAGARVKELDKADTVLRRRLIKQIVRRDIERGEKPAPSTVELLGELLAEQGLEEQDRIWGLARQVELQLAEGRADQAITRLLREMQRVSRATPSERAELLMLLGRAYYMVEDYPTALKQLEIADELLDSADPRRAEVGVLIGQIHARRNNREGAIERFKAVIADFGRAPAAIPARLGLARAQAIGDQGERDEEGAIENFRIVVEELSAAEGRKDVTRDEVKDALLGISADRFQKGEFASCRDYAELAEQLFPAGKSPGDVQRALGGSQKRLAEQLLRDKLAGKPDANVLMDLSAVDREEIKRLLLNSARAFREHARSVQDPAEYSASLWEAGDAFDMAGSPEEAVAVFGEYVDRTSDNDPRRIEAKFRLAQVLQSMRQYAAAADRYRELVESSSGGGPLAGGPWAARSVVPLAQCLLRDTDTANDAQAEKLLVEAIDGRMLDPDAEEFRNGLIELGRLLYESGRYAEAIGRLTEAIERYPKDKRADTLRFRLADSYRLSASVLSKQLQTNMPATEAAELDSARRERLRRAAALFDEYRRAIDARDPARLTQLDLIQKRNSVFYIGDCAYDLGDYRAAIAAYDAARQAYPNEPASLVAMVQIVNAYVAQGEYEKARTANEAAKRHMERFPQDVWASPNMPMEREHWKRWLESSLLLERRQATVEK